MPDAVRVLVVDDDPIQLRLLSTWMEREGCVCRTCSSGECALEILEREDHDVVILDWHLPAMDGLAVARSIRRRKGSGVPYLILATGDSGSGAIAEAFAAGMDDFVRKPVSQIEIVSRMHAASRVLRLERELHDRATLAALQGLHRGGIRELSEIVATLAHDLRTPMATLRLASSSLRTRTAQSSPEIASIADRIGRVSERMAETLDDVVSVFVAEDGSSESWMEFDLAAEVVRALEMLGAAIGTEIEFDLPREPFEIRGNPFGMRRLVLNLVSNALRHANAGRIRVGLSLASDPSWVRLEVEDDGSGIPPELLVALGEPLLLSSASHRQEFFAKGNGLGLSICRRIAAEHGGRITVSSGSGRGTRVRVWFLAGAQTPCRDADLAPLETEVRE